MKIRTGFVSNSSSSSFVVIGNPIRIKDKEVIKKLIKNDKLYAWNEGGDDNYFFRMTQKMFDLFMKYGGRIELWEVHKILEDTAKISKKDIPDEEFNINIMNVSIHSGIYTDDINEFKTLIGVPEEEDTVIEKLMTKAKKIKNLKEDLAEQGYKSIVNREGKTKLVKTDEN